MKQLDLRDIHLPETSLWWPPAPGWWLLLGLLLLCGILALWWYRRRSNPTLARLCMREFEAIRRAHASGQSEQATLNAIARLLRRALISYAGRPQLAACTGTEWRQRLEQLAPRHGFSEAQLQLLTYERYRAQPECDIDGLLRACESWIRQLPQGRPRVST